MKKDYAARADWYREKAEQAGVFVERGVTEQGKWMMKALARDFLHMAEMLDRLAAHRPSASGR